MPAVPRKGAGCGVDQVEGGELNLGRVTDSARDMSLRRDFAGSNRADAGPFNGSSGAPPPITASPAGLQVTVKPPPALGCPCGHAQTVAGHYACSWLRRSVFQLRCRNSLHHLFDKMHYSSVL